jgi:HEAT repeat protein
MYLARTLGWFHADVTLPVLRQAIVQEANPIEVEVRLAALESVAILAKELGPETVRADEPLLAAVLEASRATDESTDQSESGYKPHGELRAIAAYTLGVIGGDEAKSRLEVMLGDPYASARFNATTGLCRFGDELAIPGLVEMLDADNEEAVKDERGETLKDRKRVQVLKSAMQATLELAERNPQADFTPVKDALQKLTTSSMPKITAKQVKTGLQLNAQETLKRLEGKEK